VIFHPHFYTPHHVTPPFWNDVRLPAYQSIDKDSIASYTITSSGSGQNNALAGSTDWGGTNSMMPKSAVPGRTYPSSAYKFNSMIHSADALLPSYNIPGFTQSSSVSKTGPLTIDQIGLFRIWNNKIIWWNGACARARLCVLCIRALLLELLEVYIPRHLHLSPRLSVSLTLSMSL